MDVRLLRLPPLDSLRGFVAVGRRLSVTLAAEDLCLTQSAVSRQINTLEKSLGLKLFERGHRRLSFTPAGERLFSAAETAFAQLADSIEALAGRGESRPVTLTASVGTTALWLLPRLNRLQQQHPRIDLRVAASNQVLRLREEGIDLAIRYGAAQDMGEGAVELFTEAVVPVVHPSLRERLGDALWRRATYLEYDEPRTPWLQWSETLKALKLPRPRSMLRLNHYDQVVQACLAGQGVALGRLPLVASQLDDGALVALREPREIPGRRYWLVIADAEPRREVAEVARWIRFMAGQP
ncbi:MAG: LysR family transcriptional regulator [Burkholderiales bacterium]|uniref:LysR substrate-binding domain-containing protein n=1 Tax=Roseateles sp. TaxID=1971397 RepID=UPI000FB7CD3C|nr:MAG: LysR family transcriptional regulator [Burkholderiales bacterium]